MKSLIFVVGVIFATTLSFSQVGIGTTNPQETLDINGTLRISMTTPTGVTATKIGGLSANGTYREVNLGDNLVIQSNQLVGRTTKYTFGGVTFDDSSVNTYNNVDLLIGTGEVNEGKSIIRINITDSSGNIKFTGIKAGFDGQHVWLYPVHGTLELRVNDSNSQSANRIENNGTRTADQYSMIEIVYDASISKWVIMQNH